MEDNPPLEPAPRRGAPTDQHEGSEPDAISVAATEAVPDEPVVVSGYVVVSAGITTISDVLAESYPPQPGGSWMRIHNPEQLQLGETQSFNDTTWTTKAVRLVGRRVDEAFVVDSPVAEAEPGAEPGAKPVEQNAIDELGDDSGPG